MIKNRNGDFDVELNDNDRGYKRMVGKWGVKDNGDIFVHQIHFKNDDGKDDDMIIMPLDGWLLATGRLSFSNGGLPANQFDFTDIELMIHGLDVLRREL